MAKAVHNDSIIAESNDYKEVEGNLYFPPASVNMTFLEKSDTPYTCPWKGVCQYFNVKIGSEVFKDAAWSYPNPKDAAKHITGHVAFTDPVEVVNE